MLRDMERPVGNDATAKRGGVDANQSFYGLEKRDNTCSYSTKEQITRREPKIPVFKVEKRHVAVETLGSSEPL
jgi:hypothetical protein